MKSHGRSGGADSSQCSQPKNVRGTKSWGGGGVSGYTGKKEECEYKSKLCNCIAHVHISYSCRNSKQQQSASAVAKRQAGKDRGWSETKRRESSKATEAHQTPDSWTRQRTQHRVRDLASVWCVRN
jgi:hypothetical protein